MNGETYRWEFVEAAHITNISYEAMFYDFGVSCSLIAKQLLMKFCDYVAALAKVDSKVTKCELGLCFAMSSTLQ